ncbi:MAG: hypothetical protein AAFZ01_14285 [Pseudomonadota bacterium]
MSDPLFDGRAATPPAACTVSEAGLRIAPSVTVTERNFGDLSSIAPETLISAWIPAAPLSPTAIGPFQLYDLSRDRQPASFASLSELPADHRAGLEEIGPHLPEALSQSGFTRVREPTFPDRLFVFRGGLGFAYESVAEHLAVVRAEDVDASGLLRDPILSARTVTLLVRQDMLAGPDTNSALAAVVTAIARIILDGNGVVSTQLDRSALTDQPSLALETSQHDWLRDRWRRLFERELPRAAADRDWPVSADHCFARILLDNACGCPWREIIRPPAWRNAQPHILLTAIVTGERVLTGDADLDALNDQSLRMRGKRT